MLGARKPLELMAQMLGLCPRGQEASELFLFLFLQRLRREQQDVGRRSEPWCQSPGRQGRRTLGLPRPSATRFCCCLCLTCRRWRGAGHHCRSPQFCPCCLEPLQEARSATARSKLPAALARNSSCRLAIRLTTLCPLLDTVIGRCFLVDTKLPSAVSPHWSSCPPCSPRMIGPAGQITPCMLGQATNGAPLPRPPVPLETATGRHPISYYWRRFLASPLPDGRPRDNKLVDTDRSSSLHHTFIRHCCWRHKMRVWVVGDGPTDCHLRQSDLLVDSCDAGVVTICPAQPIPMVAIRGSQRLRKIV